MNRSTEALAAHIESTRRELGDNVRALGERAKAAGNLRLQFQRHPLTFIGLAVVGGVLVASLTHRTKGHRTVVGAAATSSPRTRARSSCNRAPKGSRIRTGVGRFLSAMVPILLSEFSSDRPFAGRFAGERQDGPKSFTHEDW
jgi:hypothetical protein